MTPSSSSVFATSGSVESIKRLSLLAAALSDLVLLIKWRHIRSLALFLKESSREYIDPLALGILLNNENPGMLDCSTPQLQKWGLL
jgi:hypothetical protein